jgi:hypothetical protein
MSVNLKQLKADEMRLRKEICAEILANKTPPCKTKANFGIIIVEAAMTVTHNIDEAALQSMVTELTPEERNAIKYKPSLLLRPYKQLSPESILHDAVVVRPNAPTLKVIV